MWTYKGTEFTEVPEGMIGFVYKITNLVSGRFYIGKKIFMFSRIRKLKGKKNQRIKKVSDWQTYTGSSEELNADIEKLGLDKFHKEILYLCSSKSSANYMEAKTIFLLGALETEMSYNRWISCRIHKVKNLNVVA